MTVGTKPRQAAKTWLWTSTPKTTTTTTMRTSWRASEGGTLQLQLHSTGRLRAHVHMCTRVCVLCVCACGHLCIPISRTISWVCKNGKGCCFLESWSNVYVGQVRVSSRPLVVAREGERGARGPQNVGEGMLLMASLWFLRAPLCSGQGACHITTSASPPPSPNRPNTDQKTKDRYSICNWRNNKYVNMRKTVCAPP